MSFNRIAKSTVVSTTVVAVSLFGAQVASASPETDSTTAQPVSDNSGGGHTARNNNNGLDWGDDWSLGGFPPINLSSMPAPEADLSVPLSVGLPGLGLPSFSPQLNLGLGNILGQLLGAAATATTVAATTTTAKAATSTTVTGLSTVANVAAKPTAAAATGAATTGSPHRPASMATPGSPSVRLGRYRTSSAS